jgi:hypothetical protein
VMPWEVAAIAAGAAAQMATPADNAMRRRESMRHHTPATMAL